MTLILHFAIWSSPTYLVDFYEENASYFEDEYWTGITVTRFVFDVRKSVPHIKRSFQQAIEVEENKCYVITGGTIKIVWAMKEAENTRVELRKIHFVYHELRANHIDTKDTFVDYLLK